MPGMALDPMPVDLVAGGRRIQLPPQVRIFHRFPGLGQPAKSFPTGHPFGDAVPHIFRVREKLHRAGPFEGVERFNGRLQFHAVVRGGGHSAAQFPPVRTAL